MTKTVTRNKNILIAEDEKAYCHALTLKLKNAGFVADGVNNGREAIDLIKKKKFDLIILDLVMPEMSGFEVLQEMQILKVDTPVIVLSNLSQSEDKKKVIELGVKEFIEKADTNIVDVIKSVEKLLQ